MNNNIISPTDLQLNDEQVVQIKRVSKATTGGRRMRFSSIVVVGDSQGHVGIGFGRANEVASAVDKARFKRTVTPGDQVYFQVSLLKFRLGTCKLSGKAFVDNKLVASAEMMATVVDRKS